MLILSFIGTGEGKSPSSIFFDSKNPRYTWVQQESYLVIFARELFSYFSSWFRFWDAAEPIWLTNEKLGGRSAVYYWPGYKAYKIKPTYYIENVIYNRTRLRGCMDRIDKIMSWLGSKQPPNFIALYNEHPDSEGHGYGPQSKEVSFVKRT